MKRIQKQFLTAAALIIVGGGAGLYTLRTKVKTPTVRLRELRESQRLFRFGRIDVKRGTLQSTTATLTFEFDRTTPGGVKIVDPLEWPGDPASFTSIINHMAGLAPDRVLTENATAEELARAGLDRPPVTFKVELRDGRTHTLYIGPKNKLVDRYPVTDANKTKISLMEPTGYWNYARPLNEFRAKQVFFVNDNDVTSLRVTDGEGQRRLLLRREQDGWKVEGPDGFAARADDGFVGLFLVRVTKHLDADEYVTDQYSPAQAAEYGLASPDLQLELQTEKHTFGAAVAFFSETDSDKTSTIVHPRGTTTLIRNTDPTLKADLMKAPQDFADRTISKFDTRKAHRVTFEVAGQATVKAERTSDGWRLTAPEAVEAKPWKLDSMVRIASLLRATRWYADRATSEQLSEWRLAPWSRRLTVETEDGQTLADVTFGKYADDNHLFIKRVDASRVGVISEKLVRVLPERWQELVP